MEKSMSYQSKITPRHLVLVFATTMLVACNSDNQTEITEAPVAVEPPVIVVPPEIEVGTESRGGWLRGAWGLNWKPVEMYNGRSETLSIEPFLAQISHLKTIDYIQVHLGESSIKSSVHIAPHELLESLWQGDSNSDGAPINLVVPRASTGVDPFLNILKAIKLAGMKTQVYVNGSNMLQRDENTPNPSYIPNITERWKAHCDTDPDIQAFINSQPYHKDTDYPNRHYMFAYAEFVLKVYSERYGDLIDGWLFDSGRFIYGNGDNATNGVKDDQKLYAAFAQAAQAGNPMAPVSFNNSPERDTEALNPFSEATHYDDYMFGHPYNGGKVIGDHELGLYARNYAHIQKVTETKGNVHSGIDPHDWEWDDKVIGHFDPPMSTSSWNGGNTPALTDEEFLLWNVESAIGGGAISWGLPLVGKSSANNENLVARSWALNQLTLMDAHLAKFQSPQKPSWARSHTTLTTGYVSQPYAHSLIEGVDFWSPNGEAITLILTTDAPTWLTLEKDPSNNNTWLLHGTPTATRATYYEFGIQVVNTSGNTQRMMKLHITEMPST